MKRIPFLLCSILYCSIAGPAAAQPEIPDVRDPWPDPNNLNAVVLGEGKDTLSARRDMTGDSKREPDLINPRRYETGFLLSGQSV